MSENSIHPTAIIDKEARLGPGCMIGAYCVVGAGVELGPDCILDNHVVIQGPTKIGRRNRFYPFGSIGQQSQDLKYDGEPTYLTIGDQNTFREFVTIHRATPQGAATVIGSHGNFLAYSHIAHDCIVGDHVIFSNNGTLAGHVTVGDYAVIGGLTAVHQFCRIGCHAITGGCSKIVQDVPPFFIADGNPAKVRGVNSVGLQRRGFSDATLRALKEAYKSIYMKNLPMAEVSVELARQAAECPEVETLAAFLNSSERGIIR